ncbi:A-kinase anchor protein 10, mitochondrial [Uranotaenia lowii]|uniref:A-kinase anchor protein 10, mitochondrial n=1 Tax=Uranotaenia lowii TaxID=190385 RepID=UPI00247A1EC2|nr:A-kinase anchor protein 10, mitochondrial [Uranotaenia lowii]
MLQFLKKTGSSRKKSNENAKAAGQKESGKSQNTDVTDGFVEPANDEEALIEAEQYWLERWQNAPEIRSRLSRSLLDILSEQSCLSFFVQFLETKDSLQLVKFWLEVESFKAAASESSKLDIRNGLTKLPNHRGLSRSISSDGYDTLSYFSLDCDSISTFSETTFEESGTVTHTTNSDDGEGGCRTSGSCTPIPTPLEVVIEEEKKTGTNEDSNPTMKHCDLTMRQSLTDDEKTQICESNKLKMVEGTESHIPVSTGKESNFNSLLNSDAVRIYRKYLMSSSAHYIEVPATILSNVSLALCGGTCSEQIFDDAQHFLLEVLEKDYLAAFLESNFYCKYTFEVLSSDNLSLKDILCSEMALFYFMEYLEQKNKRHYLEFYISAGHFCKGSDQDHQAQADAVVLYQKYFSLQATCSLNLSDKTRFIIEELICSQEAVTIKTSFRLPSRIIERFLDKRYFKDFLKSELYSKYLSELMGTIKTTPMGESPGSTLGIVTGRKQSFTLERDNSSSKQKRGHRKTFSDVTSESTNRLKQTTFVSSQNTLLAMSDATLHRKRINTVPTGTQPGNPGSKDMMHIDSKQLYNPDLLWRRNSASVGLTFGRVNALGRYERDFDMAEAPQDEDRWSRTRLKKAMRRLVNLPEDKAQEELAWQVAEMIVKDITSVTMNDGEQPEATEEPEQLT